MKRVLRHSLIASALFLAVACKGGPGGFSDPADAGAGDAATGERFSFFVTSYAALQELSGSSQGFGGDLRFGETGPGAGLRGADKICTTIAEKSMPGAAKKTWRAFLSATDDGTGNVVNAIDRIGAGPWYDRLGRVFGLTKAGLVATRPTEADPAIKDDFPNEEGVPNHQPDPSQPAVDNHDMLTGSNAEGKLFDRTATCLDWTGGKGDLATEGKPRVGHSWPRAGIGGGGVGNPIGFPPGRDGGMGGPPGRPDGGIFGVPFDFDGGFPDGGFPDGGVFIGGAPGDVGGGDMSNIDSWMSSLTESGCAPGVNLVEQGGPKANEVTVGSGGGYGGFYCFALTP